MTHPLAEAHRRIAAAEHGVEESIKRIAAKIHPRKGVTAEAEELSRRADAHQEAAARIERRADQN
jgi:hypothetical protein